MHSPLAQNREFLSQVHALYRQGYFPMGGDSGELEWYTSRVRALFPMSGITLSRSLAKSLRNPKWEITFDQAFEQVLRSCLRPKDNWITEELIDWYNLIFEDGWAHSCEVWVDSALVGGVYGLAIGQCFNAESMFHTETNASKVALHHMIRKTNGLGFQLFDAQIMNLHLESLGAFEIPRAEYLNQLSQVALRQTDWSQSRCLIHLGSGE
jgi:leucyl/phenylalanyl-tRNA---protein transferase